ncbi:hypothetical protein [Leucobacter sp. 1207-22]|uniref:hypothetical protein n=1 Tax=Leucobacter sp. 1207-22 TaxID=2604456 RepID=UPI004064713E
MKRTVQSIGSAACLTVFLSPTGCASDGPAAPVKTKPVETSRSADVTPSPTQSATPELNVPKIRDNLVVNEVVMDELGQLAKFGGDGDLAAVRAKACKEFQANNPLGGEFGAPSRTDKVEAVEARYEAKQVLWRAYVSDKFRDDQWREDISAASILDGVNSCLTNNVASKGVDFTDTAFFNAIADDKPLPATTTSPKEHSFKDPSEGYVCTSYMTATVEGQAPADVWRRFLWNETTQDWDITHEQVENPYNLSWKGLQ